jgi:hypothetical protein
MRLEDAVAARAVDDGSKVADGAAGRCKSVT